MSGHERNWHRERPPSLNGVGVVKNALFCRRERGIDVAVAAERA
jgi:hypothetical protein